MNNHDNTLLRDFVRQHHLPAAYNDTATRWFLPLADQVASRVAEDDLKVLGIVGCQGSGKSTLAALLEHVLSQKHQLKIAVLSLDDFYLGREERLQLAASVHPLLRTRGVPGTHDVALAMDTIDTLIHGKTEVAIPRFDKAKDDRRPKQDWDTFSAPADLVIFEGWCLGARPQPEAELSEPINELEAAEDPDGRWRRYVNQQLVEVYPALFQRIQQLIALLAPDFSCVYDWRRRQEQQLSADAGDAIMDDVALQRFVQHFERITRYNLPHNADADVVFSLDKNQQVVKRGEKAHGPD